MKVLTTSISAILMITANGVQSAEQRAPDVTFIQQNDYCKENGRIFFPEEDMICFERLSDPSVLFDALHEPPLTNSIDKHVTYYRFFWLRTFHHPVAIRIEIESRRIRPNSTNVATLYFKMSDGAGGYHPGKLKLSTRRSLERSELDMFLKLFKSIDVCGGPPDQEFGLDGSTWVFEYRTHGKSCIVKKWSPHNDRYEALGLYMLQLAGFEGTEENPIY